MRSSISSTYDLSLRGYYPAADLYWKGNSDVQWIMASTNYPEQGESTTRLTLLPHTFLQLFRQTLALNLYKSI